MIDRRSFFGTVALLLFRRKPQGPRIQTMPSSEYFTKGGYTIIFHNCSYSSNPQWSIDANKRGEP